MAKSSIRIPKDYAQQRRHFILEKARIEKYFPCFQCELQSNRLVCRGSIVPSEGCDIYKIRIEYKERGIPRVYIVEPLIVPSIGYHIFRMGYLCLYDHREFPWSAKMLIHETIIPWTAEWLVFYEIWKLTGEWLGPEADHGSTEKKPEEAQK